MTFQSSDLQYHRKTRLITKMINFYDTCSLLYKGNLLEDKDEKILISSITLDELENIKTSANKDANTKYTARKLLHTLNDNPEACEVLIYKEKMIKPIEKWIYHLLMI